jgi:polysaccharide pyruvyl transferase WcaK-like protein
VLRGQREFQAIQRAWSLDWEFGEPPLREVAVSAPARAPVDRASGRVAAFFSGGVDSWSTVLDNDDVTDLIFVRGIDLVPGAPHQAGLADEVEARLREVAGELGKPLHVVETNLRELSDGLIAWEAYFACPLAAVALFFEPLFERILIAGDTDYETQPAVGSSWMINQLWSTERLQIVDDGGRHNREQRLRAIADHPLVQRSLRVCWENPGGAYNCGRCRKCMLTKLSLEALGTRERFVTFPPELDLDLLGGFAMTQAVQLTLWEDALETARSAGEPEIERAIRAHVARGRRNLGLPSSHRSRHHPEITAASLFATPETARAIADARAVAVLIGSYDGSGNFGDIAQLDSGLRLFESLGPDLLVLPVLERAQIGKHRILAEEMLQPPPHALYFDPGGRPGGGLVAVGAPKGFSFAACHLYGGGYLNALWGERKLAMLAAAESLLSGGTPIVRLASGLQVDPDWVAELGEAEKRTLRSFDLLGSRDRRSTDALTALGAAGRVLESGDDAIGVLSANGGAATSAPAPGRIQVNIHFAEHPWVTEDPRRMLEFFTGFLGELGRHTGRDVTIQPLIAYLDAGIDERPGLERLAAACGERGIEVAEPRTLRPADLGESISELRRSTLTLSCSYHVALTSLMYGVPAVLLADNPYYEQKATGLFDSFDLPADFIAHSETDSRQRAREVATIVLDEERAAALRTGLARGARSLRERHEATEAELLRRIGAAAIGSLGATSPDPGALREAERRAAAAERDAAEARAQLATVLGSRSWRLAAPLRRIAARLRRR